LLTCGGLAIRLSRSATLPRVSSGKPQKVSEVSGSWPIANRPQVANLPHIASTAWLQ